MTTTGLGDVRTLLDAMNGATSPATASTIDTEDLRISRAQRSGREPSSSGLTAYGDAAELVRMLKAAPPGRPFAAVSRQLLSERPELATWLREAPPPEPAVTATSYRLTSNATAFSIETPGPGVVVLAEAWRDDAIQTTVDGKAAQGFPVNHMFRGVVVDRAGAHEIRSEYRLRAVNWALGGAMLGWVALGLWLAGVILGMQRRLR